MMTRGKAQSYHSAMRGSLPDLIGLDLDLRRLLDGLWRRPPIGEREVEQRARELLLDTIGCAIGGCGLPEVAALIVSISKGDLGSHFFPGMGNRLSRTGFVLAFSAASCALEACEGLPLAHGRPGLHAIPPALAAALAEGRTLGEVLDAVTIGYEVGARLGNVCRIRPGMHVDGTWGSYGAAATESRLRGLSPAETLAALSHAACHLPYSLYRPITYGSDARNLYVGHGALLGMASATASAAGFGGPPGSVAEHAKLALGLELSGLDSEIAPGERLILRGYLKKYPAVKHVHYGIEAGARWHKDHFSDGMRPERVTLEVYREAMTYCGNRAPSTPIQAQFSLSYAVAWSLLHGPLGARAYLRESLEDPLVRRLESLVEIVEAEDMTRSGARGCRLTVEAGDFSWTCEIDGVSGDASQPMTRSEIIDKFHPLTDPVIGPEAAERIVQKILEAPLADPLRFYP